MPSPREVENRKKGLFLAAALFIAIVITAFWSTFRLTLARTAGDFLYPYLIAFRTGADALSDQTLLVFSRRELAAQLEELRRENRRLAVQAASAAKLLVENGDLRRQLHLSPALEWDYIDAEIILRDPRSWNERFTIDRGSADGVMKGAAALTTTPEGQLILVGVVSQVNLHTSEVMTVYNPELKLSASLPLRGALGIINASGRQVGAGRLDLGFLPVKSNYIIDEILLTSGLEQQVPPGVKIGNLASVQQVDSVFSGEVFLRGTFIPAVQLNSIRFLVIAQRSNKPAE